MSKLSHIDDKGEARMVDVSDKAVTARTASRRRLRQHGARRRWPSCRRATAPKGDVLATARIAGIMAAKRTHELIPLCHPLNLTKVDVDLEPSRNPGRRARDVRSETHRPDRRRDGGADRRVGRLPDAVRHAEGGRPRHEHRRRAGDAQSPAVAPANIRAKKGA